MSLPISTIVNVVVAMPPTFPGGTGFSTLMVLGQSPSLPLGVRAKAYTSVQAVGQEFSSTSEEYKAAISFFSQNPRPPFLVIGRRVSAPAAGELLGSGNFEPNLNRWRSLGPSESLNLSVDGTPVVLTNIDFSQAVNLNGIAAAIQGAMLNPIRGTGNLAQPITDTDTNVRLQVPNNTIAIGDTLKVNDEFMLVGAVVDPTNVTVTRGTRGSTPVGHGFGTLVYIGVSGVMLPTMTFDGTRFYARSGSTGANSTVTVTMPTALSRMLGLDDGTTTTGIAAAEDVETSLDACSAATAFYGLALTRDFTDADTTAAADWAEANTKLFGAISADANMKSATSTADLASVFQGRSYARTINAYNDPPGLSDYLMVSVLARELAVDFSQPNSTITIHMKQMPGVTPSRLNVADATALDDKYSNYYTNVGSTPMFLKGRMANGTWLDQRHGLDFLAQHVADAAFAGLFLSGKIPQTDRGLQQLVGMIEVAMEDMRIAGMIAPGTWRGTGISGVVNTGEFLDKGYKVVAASIASQSEQDRMARKAPPITIACKGAGAIQEVDIYIQFEP